MEWLFIITGILFIVYGIMVGRIGSGTSFFMVWICIGIMMLAAFIIIHTGIWSRLPAYITVAVKTAATALILMLVIVEGIILSGFTYWTENNLDYIIVLGAQVKEDGPSVVLKYRLDKAYDYLKDNEATICIVSGGQCSNEPCTEAEAMERYLEDRGITSSRIIREDRSRSTLENLKFSKELIKEDASVGIVTNNFHIFRRVAIAKKQGYTDVCGIPAPSNPVYLPNNMLREFFGVIKDKLRGNI